MTDSPLSKVLTALHHHSSVEPKRRGQGWMAQCPAHDDLRPSLSIKEGDDERVLLHCHAGCSAEAVVAELRLTMRDLMPERPGVGGHGSGVYGKGVYENRPGASARGNIVDIDNVDYVDGAQTGRVYATEQEAVAALERQHGRCSQRWTYHDGQGEPVGVVLRWDGPGGKKIRPVNRRRSGWVMEGMPAPRPLYELPALDEAKRVYVCEGEKPADAVRALGLIATTSAHGSKSAAKTDWQPLAGKLVIVLPDQDQAGDRYADDVIQILTQLHPAPTIKVVHLPGLSDRGDAHDYVTAQRQAGQSDEKIRTELARLVDEAQPVESVRPMKLPSLFVPFPVEVLPKPLASFVTQGAKAIGCDPSYLALPLLSALASAIGNTRRIKLKEGWAEPAILWVVIVGDSGTLKSPSLELALRPVRRRQDQAMHDYHEAMQQYQGDLVAYERDLAQWKKTQTDEQAPQKPEEPVPDRCWCSDTTVEALVTLLVQQPRGLLMARDELAGWIKGFDRYTQGKGGDVAMWLEMHGGRSIGVDRKSGHTRTLYVPRAAVSIAGGIQPETLRRALGVEHRENGLAARLLLAWPPRRVKQWTDDEIPTQLTQALEAVFKKLYGLRPNVNEEGRPCPVDVPLTDEGKAAWVAYFNEHATEQAELSGELSAAWSKLEGYAARFALVVHFVRWATADPTLADPDRIDEHSIQAGVDLSRWFGHEAKRVYAMLNESEESRDRRRLIELIQTKGGSISGSELVRASRAYTTAKQAEAALDEMVAAGFGRWEQPPQTGRGRPPARWFVLNDNSVYVYENTPGASAKGNIVDDDRADADSGWGEEGEL